MEVDFNRDMEKVVRYLKRRVQDYPKYANLGPGRDEDPVSMVTIGFEFDKPSWIALVFDTRSGADPDGQWQNYIASNSIQFPNWAERYEALYFAKEPMVVKRADGSKATFTECNAKSIAKCFGDSLRSTLLSLRDDGVFKGIPLTDDYILCVEHHEGQYGSMDHVNVRR